MGPVKRDRRFEIHPCAQEDRPAKIPAACEDAAKGPGSNHLFHGPETGHVPDPGEEADIAEVQTIEQKYQNNVAGRYSTSNSCSEKVALNYGINRREVC